MNQPALGTVTPFPATLEEKEIDLAHFPTIKEGDWLGGHVYPPNSRHFVWSVDSLLLLPLSAATIQEAMTAYKDMLVVNANVIEWLLTHTDLIPEDWKKYSIHFLGSFFTHKVIGSPFIYCLEYKENEWAAVEARFNSKPSIGKAQLLLFK
jgi:hypothetical protein